MRTTDERPFILIWALIVCALFLAGLRKMRDIFSEKPENSVKISEPKS